MEEAIISHNLTFSTNRDLMGVCQAIIRLQDVYNLNESNILNGNFQKYWDGAVLTCKMIIYNIPNNLNLILIHTHCQWMS